MAFDAAMSTHEDLLATIRYVRDRTGDPNAWQTGLTPTEVTAVVTSTTRSEQLDAILRKIRQRHSNLYYPAPPDREQGDAAVPSRMRKQLWHIRIRLPRSSICRSSRQF